MSSGERPARTILILDDDRDFREALAEIIQSAGYTVAHFGNGREGMAYLRSHPPPSLILLNLMMPVMNGWSFASEIDQDSRLRGIPLLLLSGLSDLDRQARALGAADYLTKPLEVPLLLEKLERLAGSG